MKGFFRAVNSFLETTAYIGETTKEIKNHLTANAHISKKDIVLGNFLGGLAWGVGSVIGATIVVAILLVLLRAVDVVPVLGDFVQDVREQSEVKTQK